MCSDAPKPDKGIGEAAKANAAIAKEALEYYKAKDIANQPRQDRMDDLSEQLASQQIETSKFNTSQAKEQWGRYQANSVPVEDAMFTDAMGYDTDQRQEAEAGKAGAAVEQQITQATEAQARSLARMGVNPNSGRAGAASDAMAITGALGKAAAENTSRKSVADMGIMLRKDAANFGRGMTSTAAQTYGVAQSAGASATGAIRDAAAMSNASTAQMGAGFGIGINGNQSAGDLYNKQFQAEVQAAGNSGIGAAIGGIAQGIGAAGGMGAFFSDENIKDDIAPIDDAENLEGIKNTTVKRWKYKEGSVADDGRQEHIGAMAQDLQKNLGDTVAPGGTQVDVASAIGVNMSATKALAKESDQNRAALADVSKQVSHLSALIEKRGLK